MKRVITILVIALALVTASINSARAADTTITVSVDARAGWVDTGVTLTNNTIATITATGHVSGNVNCPDCSQQTSPDGNDPPLVVPEGEGFLAPGIRAHSLVGRVGDASPVFVGSGPTEVSGVGKLYLAFNDNVFHDNSGEYKATIKVTWIT